MSDDGPSAIELTGRGVSLGSAIQAGMCIEPEWALPFGVSAAMTTRRGGASAAPYDTLNLGDHVGDVAAAVTDSRARLRTALGVDDIAWLRQVHGNRVARIDSHALGTVQEADAAITSLQSVALAVMVADCLPVLMTRTDGLEVAVAHAGWRGLANGVLVATVAAFAVPGSLISCWLGPSISAAHYEVDETVRSCFGSSVDAAFSATSPGHYRMDLRLIAELQLRELGVQLVRRSAECAYAEPALYFSHRRDRVTGRCAALIWRHLPGSMESEPAA